MKKMNLDIIPKFTQIIESKTQGYQQGEKVMFTIAIISVLILILGEGAEIAGKVVEYFY
jgi:cell division protein FtsL